MERSDSIWLAASSKRGGPASDMEAGGRMEIKQLLLVLPSAPVRRNTHAFHLERMAAPWPWKWSCIFNHWLDTEKTFKGRST